MEKPTDKDFRIGMKVALNGENGLVVKPPLADEDNLAGWVLWDTPSREDLEDWRGLWGSFHQSGGCILPANTVFSHICEA